MHEATIRLRAAARIKMSKKPRRHKVVYNQTNQGFKNLFVLFVNGRHADTTDFCRVSKNHVLQYA